MALFCFIVKGFRGLHNQTSVSKKVIFLLEDSNNTSVLFFILFYFYNKIYMSGGLEI